MKKEVIATSELMNLVIESINNNQKATFKVTGSSMTPFFTHGKTSVTIRKNELPYQKYDVILFKYKESFKLHRVIKINDREIVARGDALFAKEIISVFDIIGIVESFENDGVITLTSDKSYLKRVRRYLLFKPISLRLRRFK